jgi:single-strand DNA-binding protein
VALTLNKAQIIGNVTRDPELRYTPNGAAVCSFSVATSRSWRANENSEWQEETEFHNVVAWNKLAERCGEQLAKGKKVYVEGRIQTRSWESQEGEKRYRTEIIAEDVIFLDRRGRDTDDDQSTGGSRQSAPKPDNQPSEDINPDEIPF